MLSSLPLPHLLPLLLFLFQGAPSPPLGIIHSPIVAVLVAALCFVFTRRTTPPTVTCNPSFRWTILLRRLSVDCSEGWKRCALQRKAPSCFCKTRETGPGRPQRARLDNGTMIWTGSGVDVKVSWVYAVRLRFGSFKVEKKLVGIALLSRVWGKEQEGQITD